MNDLIFAIFYGKTTLECEADDVHADQQSRVLNFAQKRFFFGAIKIITIMCSVAKKSIM